MADIDVVPKGRSATWIWWVIAAVIIVIALMWMLGRNRTTAGAPSSMQQAPLFEPAPAAVAAAVPSGLA
jgi:hypothetical protein